VAAVAAAAVRARRGGECEREKRKDGGTIHHV
jgi:hypothetical protein